MAYFRLLHSPRRFGGAGPHLGLRLQLPADPGRHSRLRVHSVSFALAPICIALWGYASWSTMGLTLPSDLLPHDVVATVTGMSGLAAGLVSAAFTFAVGMLVDRFSYGPAFLVAGLMPLFATVCLFVLIRPPNEVRGSV